MEKLFKVRLISTWWTLVGLFAPALFAVIESEKFIAFLSESITNKFIAGLVVVVLPQIVMHLRNVAKLGKLGARVDDEDFQLI